MLTLAAGLRSHCRLAFAFQSTCATESLFARAVALGGETFPLHWPEGDRSAARRFTNWLRERNFDIFHAHAGIGWEGHAGITAARRAKIPVVVRTEHLPYLLVDARTQAQYRSTLRHVDCIVCVSREAAGTHIAAGVPSHMVRVIRNGIYAKHAVRSRPDVRAALGIRGDRKVILTVARMAKQKGYDDLLAAVPQIVARETRALFVWAGVGAERERLFRSSQELGLSDRIFFVGQRADVPDLMTAADLFVLPSLFEGLPLAVLEAMKADLPVIGTRVCGISETIVDDVTGRLARPGDPASLAAAILEALSEPKRTARWVSAARRRVEHEFSAERMAQETLALYDELLARSAAQADVVSSSSDAAVGVN